MDMDNASSVFQIFLVHYRHHSLYAKDIQWTNNCSEGIQWAWLELGECLLRPSHILGFWIGLLVLPLWIVGTLRYHLSLVKQASPRVVSYLTLTFIIDTLSLTGSVMSMQVLTLIIFGVVTIVIDCIGIVAFIMMRKSFCTPRYGEIHNDEDLRPKRLPDVGHLRRCCHVGCLLLACGVLLLLLLAGTQQDGVVSLPGIQYIHSLGSLHAVYSTSTRTLNLIRRLYVVGYVLGCITCVGHVGINHLKQRLFMDFVRSPSLNRRPVCKETMLLTFDFLFIGSILLQSGRWSLALMALPWIVQRLIHGLFQLLIIYHKVRSHLAEKFEDNNKLYDENDDDDDDVIFDKDDRHLLKSSESEESRGDLDCPVSMDNRLVSSIATSHKFADQQIKSSSASVPVIQSRPRIYSFETGSTSESESSSMSQIQEFELYRDGRLSIPRIVVHPSDSFSFTSRPSSLSLNRLRMSSLNNTSSESHDQRVRSWVSQHTPEEELVSPPSLALTLNLDTTTPLSSPSSPCCDFHPELSRLLPQNEQFRYDSESAWSQSMAGLGSNSYLNSFYTASRLGYTLGVLSMTPRKNSL